VRGLLGARQDLDAEPAAFPCGPEQVIPVVGIADRARRHHVDGRRIHAAAAAVAGEHPERFEPSRHGLGLKPPGAPHPLRDPHGLAEVADRAPRDAGDIRIDDETP